MKPARRVCGRLRLTESGHALRLALIVLLLLAFPLLFGAHGWAGTAMAVGVLWNPTARTVFALIGWFPVGLYGAKTNGTDARPGIQAAIEACSVVTGGRVILSIGNYLLASATGAAQQGALEMRPNVRLHGAGSEATRLLLGSGLNYSFVGARSTLGAYATVTANIAVGDYSFTVDSSAAFTVGQTVFFRLGDNPLDANESLSFGFAKVRSIADATHVTLDLPSERAVTVGSTTALNKRIYPVTTLMKNIGVFGMSFISDGVTAEAEEGVNMQYVRDVEMDDLYGEHVGAGLVVGQYVENFDGGFFHLGKCKAQNGESAKGRGIDFAESRNVHIRTFVAEDFESTALLAEFGTDNFRVDTVELRNTAASRLAASNNLVAALTGSSISIGELTVRGKSTHNGGALSVVAQPNPAFIEIENYNLLCEAQPNDSGLHLVRGRLRMRQNDGTLRTYYMRDIEAHTMEFADLPSLGSSYPAYGRAGILLKAEIYVSAGATVGVGNQVRVFLGRTGDNGSEPGAVAGQLVPKVYSGGWGDGSINTQANFDKATKVLLSLASPPAGSKCSVTLYTLHHRFSDETAATNTVANEPGSERYERFTAQHRYPFDQLTGTATWDPASIADGAMTSTTLTVTGAVIGDTVSVGFSNAVPAGAILSGSVTATNTVTVTLFNKTGGALDLASGTLRADVWRH